MTKSFFRAAELIHVPRSGYSQGGLWMSQWHPLALAPGCFTILSHCSIHLLLASHNFLSILGYFFNPRRKQRCPLGISTLASFIVIDVYDILANTRLNSSTCRGRIITTLTFRQRHRHLNKPVTSELLFCLYPQSHYDNLFFFLSVNTL